MPDPSATPTNLVLPVQGVDYASPLNAIPDGFCADALNVRALTANDRVRVGGRRGHTKAFIDAVDGTKRILHIQEYAEARGVPSVDGAPVSSLSVDFTTLNTSDTDISDNFVVASVDVSRPAVGTSFDNYPSIVTVSSTNVLRVEPDTALSTSDCGIAASRWASTNRVEAVGWCNSQNASSSRGNADGNVQGYGVFTHVGNTLDTAIIGRVTRGSANDQAVIQILEVTSGGGLSVIATSGDLALDDSATYKDINFTIETVDDTVTLTVSIPALGTATGNSTDAGWDGTTVTADLTVDFSEDFTAKNRCGIGAVGDGIARYWKSVTVSRLVPVASPAVQSFAATREPASGQSRYFVPDGVSTAQLQGSAGNATVITGPDSSANISSSPWDQAPSIDSTNDYIEVDGSPSNGGSVAYLTDAPTARRAVRIIPRDLTNAVRFPGLSARVSDNGRTFVTSTRASTAFSATLVFQFVLSSSEWNAEYFVDGVLQGSESVSTGADGTGSIIFHVDDDIVFVDEGADYTLIVNGMEMVRHTWGSALTTAVADTERTGLYFGDDGSDRDYFGGSWIQAASGDIDFADNDPNLVIFTQDNATAANLTEGTLLALTGTSCGNALIDSTQLLGKVYAVDGDRSVIVDPVAGTVSSWSAAVTAGSLPAGCRLVTNYRGRIVLARQDANPSIYYMTRLLNALDFDFGADPVATSAVVGTDPSVGQPGDAIVALISHNDDLLLFMCASSIYVMEGDPGYGGQVQTLSNKTGIIGQRAWTYDDRGNLYWVSVSGLHRMRLGTREIEHLSGRRLRAILDRINPSETLVQLAYDSFNNYVGIFLTPSDGTTVGTHVIYDVEADAYWPDQYPLFFGPWAVVSVFGTTLANRGYLLGGDNSFIYRPDPDATLDDTQTINHSLRFKPIESPMGVLETMCVELHAEGDVSTTSLIMSWLTAEAAAYVNAVQQAQATRSFNFSFANGVHEVVRVRARAPAHQLLVTQDSASSNWALDRVTAWMKPSGRRRGDN